MNLYGAVELGGTKTLVATGHGNGEVVEMLRLETGDDPEATCAAVVDFLSSREIVSVGIASFGPLELRADSSKFGSILPCPKPGWSGFDLIAAIGAPLRLPVSLDTDVNGAVLAEGRWGASQGLAHHVYITVGTGIGAGIVSGGAVLRGLGHPEFGHIPVERHPADDFLGACPYHGACLEGMAAGPALEARFDSRLSGVDPAEREQSVVFTCFYLAQGVRSLIYSVSPQRVVIGGGVSNLPGFHTMVRKNLLDQLAGCGVLDAHNDDHFIVAPALGDRSGLIGGLALAADLID